MSDSVPLDTTTVDPQRSARWLVVSLSILYLLHARSPQLWILDRLGFSENRLAWDVSYQIVTLVSAGGIAAWVVLNSPHRWRAIGVQLDDWPGDLVIGGACGAAVAGVIWLVRQLIPPATRSQEYVSALQRFAEQNGVPGVLFQLIVIVTIGALAEELFFRGIVQSLLRASTGKTSYAILGSTVLFVAAHRPEATATLVSLALGGATLGGLFARRKSLLAPLAMHACFNLTVLLSATSRL